MSAEEAAAAAAFKYRLASCKPGVKYLSGHEPCGRLDGRVAYWESGSMTLSSFSAPKDFFAVFKTDSTGQTKDIEFTDKYRDPKYRYYWPKNVPDDAYAIYTK